MHPKTDGILETSLYVSDVPRSIRFYEQTFGFNVISDFGERGCVTARLAEAGVREGLARVHADGGRVGADAHAEGGLVELDARQRLSVAGEDDQGLVSRRVDPVLRPHGDAVKRF